MNELDDPNIKYWVVMVCNSCGYEYLVYGICRCCSCWGGDVSVKLVFPVGKQKYEV